MWPWWAQVTVGMAAVAACVAAVLRGLWLLDTHSHSQYCECARCSGARRRLADKLAAEKRVKELERRRRLGDSGAVHSPTTPTATDPGWLNTAELDSNMRVSIGNGSARYHISSVRTDHRGYLIALKNLDSGKEMIAPVPLSQGKLRWWKPLAYWER
jgi:hypothetical protein